MNSLQVLTLQNESRYTPVTCITPIKGTDLILSGTATRIQLSSLNSDQLESQPLNPRRWKLFERERIHRIVLDPRELSDRRRAVVLGGKEAVLVELTLDESNDSERAQLRTLCRFALDDFAGDASFLSEDKVIISTLHNSILIFSLLSVSSATPSSSSSSSIPLRYPITTVHASARPLLWTSRFSQSFYDEGNRVRLGGGSLLGTVLVWDIDLEELSSYVNKVELEAEQDRMGEERVIGKLSSLSGHRGAIFTVVFSPDSPDLLASGSDDRTIRIWNLSPLSVSPESTSTNNEGAEKMIEAEARVLWGHEGRVWRIEWVDEERLLSVGEDATCRLWKLNSNNCPLEHIPSTSTSKPHKNDSSLYTVLQTWRDGHDGRSIWSVNLTKLRGREGGEIEVALTGGADGGLRSWTLPSTLIQDSHATIPIKTKKLEQGAQIKSFVVSVDPSSDQPVAVSLTNNGSFYLSNPSTSLQNLIPFHSSPSFANTATSLHLTFDSTSSNQATLQAFTNRGTYLFARFSFTPSDNSAPSEDSSSTVKELVEHNIGIKAVSCTFNEDRTKLAIWERASWKVHICSLPSPSPSPSPSSSPPTRLSTIDILPSQNGSTAPTCALFLDDSYLLLGSANGTISLHSLPSTESPSTLLSTLSIHEDGVSDLRVLRSQTQENGGNAASWEIESVGRDGMRKSTEMSSNDDGRWSMRVVDERWIAKGTIEKILAQESGETRYLALVDTRAAVFDSLGRLLFAFDSPAKQSSSQYLESQLNGSYYYSVIQGKLSQQRISTSSVPSAVSPGLHGREVRAVKMQRVEIEGEEVILVASAAENGVLAISQLHRDTSIRTLYLNRYLPSSLKSLTFSPPQPSLSGTRSTLYACGTRELLTAFEIAVVSSGEESENEKFVEVRVLERGTILADVEGGEVRTMDISLIETSVEGERLVVGGYSDGKLKLWRHSRSIFELVAETEGLGKCVLSVEVEKVVVAGGESMLLISGQSDGRLSIRDLTSFIDPRKKSALLPVPFFVSSPHQSGINGLSVSSRESTLIVATAGDDNAVSVARIELSEIDGKLGVSDSSSTTVQDAHGSTIQGLDFLSPTLLASSSVEQRLNFYSLDSIVTPAHLQLVTSTCLDVADCSAQDVVRLERREGGEEWKVVVAGIGMEVVKASVGAV